MWDLRIRLGGLSVAFFFSFWSPPGQWNLFLSHLGSPGSHQDVLPALFSQPTETDCSVPTQAFKGLWGWCHPIGSQKGKSPSGSSFLHFHARQQVLLSTFCLCPVLCSWMKGALGRAEGGSTCLKFLDLGDRGKGIPSWLWGWSGLIESSGSPRLHSKLLSQWTAG